MMDRSHAMRTIDTIYIDGAFVTPRGDDRAPLFNPATEHRSARFASAMLMLWTSRLPQPNAGDECHHPLHEAASPFPDPGVVSAGYLH
jgi:hypothetical protein